MPLTSTQINEFNTNIAQASDYPEITVAAKNATDAGAILSPANLDKYLPAGTDPLEGYEHWLVGWETLSDKNPEIYNSTFELCDEHDPENYSHSEAKGSYSYLGNALFRCEQQKSGFGGANSSFSSETNISNFAVIPFAVCSDGNKSNDEFEAMAERQRSKLRDEIDAQIKEVDRNISHLADMIADSEEGMGLVNDLIRSRAFEKEPTISHEIVWNSRTYSFPSRADAQKFMTLLEGQKQANEISKQTAEKIRDDLIASKTELNSSSKQEGKEK